MSKALEFLKAHESTIPSCFQEEALRRRRNKNYTAKLFDEQLTHISPEIKIELDISSALADKIDVILRERSISTKQFAVMMRTSEAEVSRWLGGTHNFTLRTIAKISDALGVKLITL